MGTVLLQAVRPSLLREDSTRILKNDRLVSVCFVV